MSVPEPLVIVGAGDHGRVVLDLLRALNRNVVGFVQPAGASVSPAGVAGVPVLGSLDEPSEWTQRARGFLCALGNNRARADGFIRCVELGLEPVAAVHPSAILLGGATVEPGAMVCAGAVVGVDAHVGENAIINTGATIDHDNQIGAHATVAPGAHLAGRVELGEGAFVGIGAAVREGIRIGAWATVGGGAMVIRDVEAGSLVMGVPAMPADAQGRDG
ncbi:MAG TPA: acetyltransferase [Gemmatimonadales bacterium]|nr:acetyltransferase [Gemmatimonadales bacterium]